MESIFLLITFMYCVYRFFLTISELKYELKFNPRDRPQKFIIFLSIVSLLFYGHFGIAMARVMLNIV